MLQEFKAYIKTQSLIARGHRTLLAVSGGVDSAVMVDLFRLAGLEFAVAHCNFGLRGEESDGDEDFVRLMAKEHRISFHSVRFDTDSYARENGISIQMAARELRYDWFEKLRQAENYDLIAVASHQNDASETVLINLVRGTGIAGLHGISPKRARIIRPLMFATREQIERFAEETGLVFREDSSNTSEQYVRNKIRQKVIPVLKEINPDIEATMADNIQRFMAARDIYFTAIEEKRKKLLHEENNRIFVSIDKLAKLHPLDTYLFEFLRPFHFNASTVKDIIASLYGNPGKTFYSPTHQLLKDRSILIIAPRNSKKAEEGITLISKQQQAAKVPLALKFEVRNSVGFNIPDDRQIACLDHTKLHFPLTLRRWQEGDAFHPLGMSRKKKVSDFLTDIKMPLFDKEKTFVMTSGKDIVWLVGQRIDDRYKVAETTKKIYLAQLV